MNLIIRLFIVLTVSIFLLTSNSFAQNSAKAPEAGTLLDKEISLTFSNKPIQEVLKLISAKYSIRFSYVNNDIPLAKLVSGSFISTSLNLVLGKIFSGTLVKYYALSKQIVLKVEQPAIIGTPAQADTAVSKVSPESAKKADSTITILPVKTKNVPKDSTEQNKSFGFDFLSLFTKRHKGNEDTVVTVLLSDTLSKDTSSETKEKKQPPKILKIVKRTKNLEERWSIGLLGVAGYSYRSLSGQNEEVSQRNNSETRKFSPGFGISLRYSLNKHFFVGSGLQYTRLGENGNYSAVYRRSYINRSGQGGQPGQQVQPGYVLRDTSFSYSNSCQYLGIPLMVGLKTSSRLSFGINVGLLVNLLVAHSSNFPSSSTEQNKPGNTYFDQNLNANKHELRNMNLAAFISCEMTYKINAKVALSLAPLFNYALTSIYKSADGVSSKPYLYGLSIGVHYNLSSQQFTK